MSRLAEQQQALLALIKNKPLNGCQDEWVTRISHSPELEMMREIARWWRRYQVSAQCRFTARLLKRSGLFEDAVNRYFEQTATSPFIEELARGFLSSFAGHTVGLAQSVALTELAMLNVASGEKAFVHWDRNPDSVFSALEKGTPLPDKDDEFDYHLQIGPQLECVRVPSGPSRTKPYHRQDCEN